MIKLMVVMLVDLIADMAMSALSSLDMPELLLVVRLYMTVRTRRVLAMSLTASSY